MLGIGCRNRCNRSLSLTLQEVSLPLYLCNHFRPDQPQDNPQEPCPACLSGTAGLDLAPLPGGWHMLA